MKTVTIAAIVLLPALALAAAPKQPKQAAGDVRIGKLILRISESESAQVFHVVDQLSEWSEFCHHQYGRWAAKAMHLTDADRKLLAQHAALRKAHGWGGGFEQSFYVDSTIEHAASRAFSMSPHLGDMALTNDELKAERAILLHFAPKVRPLLDAQREEVRRFRERLANEADRIAPTVEKLAHFTGVTEPVVVPVFLIPNPEKGSSGGGYNGGRLVLEIQSDPDPLPTFLHEALHALLESRDADLAAATKRANGLDEQALREGIAYALAPGIISTRHDGGDELSEWLAIDVLRGLKPTNSYLRFKLVALVLRPLLRDALDRGETIAEFLPRAVDKWNHVQSRR